MCVYYKRAGLELSKQQKVNRRCNCCFRFSAAVAAGVSFFSPLSPSFLVFIKLEDRADEEEELRTTAHNGRADCKLAGKSGIKLNRSIW